MRKWIAQHTDLVFLLVMVLALTLAAGLALNLQVISMQGWQTNFDRREVTLGEMVDMNDRDAIQPINTPHFVPVMEATWLADDSPVIALTVGGETRAYPLPVLLVHQVVNDTIQGVPVAVTYCPLCNSAIVYRRQVDDSMLTFSSSGKLRRSGFIMWDDKTQSWWQQFTGKAIVGDYTGTMLEIMPSQVVGYGQFRDGYPQSVVLAGDVNLPDVEYGTSPFAGYDTQESPPYLNEDYDTRLEPMERVLASEVNGQPVAYPFSLLAQEHVINDTVADVPLVAFWQPGAVSVLDNASIDRSRDVGMAVMFLRELDDGTILTFHYEDDSIMDDATGSTWNIFGEAIDGELAGTALPQMNCFPHFWFAWAATYPDTLLYGVSG